MSRYLIIAADYKPNPGGIATYLDTLARGFIELGHTTKILAIVHPDDRKRMAFLENYEKWVVPFPMVYDERPKHWAADRLVSGLEIVRCASRPARRLLDRSSFFSASSSAVSLLRDTLTREEPSMVVFGHLYITFYPLVFALMDQNVPFGIIAHDSEIYRNRGRINNVVRKGMMLKKAAWIAANSRHTKSLLEAWGLASDKIMILHPPISAQAIIESNGASAVSDKGAYTLLTVCRLVRAKGIDIVLRALKRLSEQGIDFRYVVAGEGSERAALESLARELGIADRTQFVGYVEDEVKWSLLRSADVFVMSSRVNPREQHEGFGIAFVEAGAFGVPVVGSFAGGIPEAILDGKTGILVQPESPEKLADALELLYRNPKMRLEMGAAGKRRAQSQFSPKTVAARFQEEISRRI